MTISRIFTDGADAFAVKVNDTYLLDFAGGDDVLRVMTGTVTAHMGLGADRVRIDGGSATIFGDAGADRSDIYGGTATVSGGADNDRFNVWSGSGHVLHGDAGDDTFVFYGGATAEHVSGGAGNDRFYGNGFAVSGRINGGAGDDAFYGFANAGALHVTLAGGAGNDLYRVQSSSGPDIIENAAEGSDTVQLARGISYTLGANIENLKVADTLGAGEDATLTGNGLSNRMIGSSGRDTINGMAGNDVLTGGAGNDGIAGGDGNDRIIGGLGGDSMAGGAGRDLYVYTSTNEAPVAAAYEDQDFITDWTPQDRIDLSAIDANSLIDGHQSFEFAGYSFGEPPSSHTAGSLWIGGFAGQLWIVGFTDNDATADFLINFWPDVSESALTTDNLIL